MCVGIGIGIRLRCCIYIRIYLCLSKYIFHIDMHVYRFTLFATNDFINLNVEKEQNKQKIRERAINRKSKRKQQQQKKKRKKLRTKSSVSSVVTECKDG